MKKTRPLKITAYMQTGKIATRDLFLPLDSILAYVWVKENKPENMIVSANSIKPEELIEPELPLEKRSKGYTWYWACSFACGEVRGEEIIYWHKRFDQKQAEKYVDFGKRRGKVSISAGYYKNLRMPLITYLIPKVEWYAVGDEGEVKRILSQIFFIGIKRGRGLGRVLKWKVEEWPEDLSHLRPIPDKNGNAEVGIRSPYWLSANWEKCNMPKDNRLLCNFWANQKIDWYEEIGEM